ncbi:MAG: hypothetical protein ACYCPS_05375 [Candidatus Saccharimonadales bacterium]
MWVVTMLICFALAVAMAWVLAHRYRAVRRGTWDAEVQARRERLEQRRTRTAKKDAELRAAREARGHIRDAAGGVPSGAADDSARLAAASSSRVGARKGEPTERQERRAQLEEELRRQRAQERADAKEARVRARQRARSERGASRALTVEELRQQRARDSAAAQKYGRGPVLQYMGGHPNLSPGPVAVQRLDGDSFSITRGFGQHRVVIARSDVTACRYIPSSQFVNAGAGRSVVGAVGGAVLGNMVAPGVGALAGAVVGGRGKTRVKEIRQDRVVLSITDAAGRPLELWFAANASQHAQLARMVGMGT